MRYPRVTITGADERTNLLALAEIDVEVGILYSNKLNGQNPRYPAIELIEKMTRELPHTALHVCGSIGRQQAIEGELPFTMDRIGRIQVNGKLTAEQIELICWNYPAHTIITQVANPFGEHLDVPWAVRAPNHAILIDDSGGKGEYPSAGWRRPDIDKFRQPVGFAGGLSPDNVGDVLEELAKRFCITFEGHGSNWWIDMEGKVRDENDWLDLAKVRAVHDIAFEKLGFDGYFRRVRP